MLKRLTLQLLVLLSTLFSVPAATVPVEDARNVALNFYRVSTGAGHSTGQAALCYTGKAKDSIAAYYVFDITPGKGFVIVSASDASIPVLGYSTDAQFKAGFEKTGLADWLGNWSDEIYYIRQNGIRPGARASALWAAYRQGSRPPNLKSTGVGPLCKTTWDQEPLYNADCPEATNSYYHAVTGCVATAMAQIMKYWNYPLKGTGTASYNDIVAQGYQYDYGQQTFQFNNNAFNWAAMPDSLTASMPQQNISAVALLMYACGVSVSMDYGEGGSGAWVVQTESTNGTSSQYAYLNYFRYNPLTLQEVDYNGPNYQSWIALLENEFNAGRPVQYQGYGNGGGHSWVCDGYDNNDLVHMNWGWGGLDNGWYAVTDMNPGGETFYYDIRALIGIEPGVFVEATHQTICAGSSTNLSVANVPLVANYNWSPVAGLSCTNCANPTASPQTSTTYTVSVDSGGNSFTSSINIHVSHAGVFDYQLSQASVCEGSSDTLELYGASGISITPSQNIAWADSQIAILTPAVNTLYNVSAQSTVCGNGEGGQINIQVTQHQPVTFNLSSQQICAGQFATLTWQGLSNVQVMAGSDYFYGDTGIVLTPNQDEFYLVSGTSSCGSTITDTFTMQVMGRYISYSLSAANICRGDSAILVLYGVTNPVVTPSGLATRINENTFVLKPTYNTYFSVSGSNMCDTNTQTTFAVNVVNDTTLLYGYNNACAGINNGSIWFEGIRNNIQSVPALNFIFRDSTDAVAYPPSDTSTTYHITVETVCGNIRTVEINYLVAPYFSYTVQPPAICSGDTALLSLYNGSEFVLTAHDSTFTRLDSSHYLLYPSASDYYSVSVLNCNYDFWQDVQLNVQQPGESYYHVSTHACAGESVYLSLTGIFNPVLTPAETLYMSDSADYYAYLTPVDTVTYTLTGQSVCGGHVLQSFTLNVSPISSFWLQSAYVCPGGFTTLHFDNFSNIVLHPYDSLAAGSIVWLSDSVVELKPDSSTWYYFDATGCGGNYDDYVQLEVVPDTAYITGLTDSVICPGDNRIIYLDYAKNITINPSVNIYYVDSTYAYAQLLPTHEHTNYIVNYTSLCSAQQYSDTLRLRIAPGGSYFLSKSLLCGHDSAMLDLSEWYSGIQIEPLNGVHRLNFGMYSLQPEVTTTYTFSGYSACNYDFYSYQVTIEVDSPPGINASIDNSTVCPGGTLMCANNGFASYLWSTGQPGECATAPATGYYTVTGTDTAGCRSRSAQLYAVVNGDVEHVSVTTSFDTLFAPVADGYQWLLDGKPISGANASYLVAGDTGSYTVFCISSNGCMLESQPVNGAALVDKVIVYPNPSSGNWYLKTGGAWLGGIFQIFDCQGRLIFSNDLKENPQIISTDRLDSGVYIIRLISGKNIFTSKLIKI